jgi:N-acetylmuramoyl-L-alanine amidase
VVGLFCPATLVALHDFQHRRGLRQADVCDHDTWRALVEAGWRLGDRLIVLTSPNLRGDDVVELQTRLARLGFDTGRVDGIFGPNSARALTAFQLDTGVAADGVCGPATVLALDRIISQTGSGPGIVAVRERHEIGRSDTTLATARIAVGHFGGLGAIGRAVSRTVRSTGATVMPLDEPDPVAQALASNRFGATAYVGFEAVADERTVVHFYRVPTFESASGRLLAEHLTCRLAAIGLPVAEPVGLRLPVLRETKMTAVLCSVAPVRHALDVAPAVAEAVAHALSSWFTGADVTTLLPPSAQHATSNRSAVAPSV